MIKCMVLTCDHCCEEVDDFESMLEATECGWWILTGPERYLGSDGEKVYCSKECLEADL